MYACEQQKKFPIIQNVSDTDAHIFRIKVERFTIESDEDDSSSP